MATGLLALVGGDEFKSGNEQQDRLLVEHRAPGTAYVVATAAARQRPELAVATAQRWFKGLGLDVVELPVRKRSDAASPANVALAEEGGFFYLTGGDPGLVVDVLRDTPVLRAMLSAWRSGAVLAGSSAGAMAFGEWTLVRKAYPGHARRRYKPALDLVPRLAVAPHFETFGHRWVDSVLAEPPVEDVVIGGIDERSAVLWDGDVWTARGPGQCHRRDQARSQRLPARLTGPTARAAPRHVSQHLAEPLLDSPIDADRLEALEHLDVAIPELRDMHMAPSLQRARQLQLRSRRRGQQVQFLAGANLTA